MYLLYRLSGTENLLERLLVFQRSDRFFISPHFMEQELPFPDSRSYLEPDGAEP
jgi:hypothetical protein